MIEERRLCRVQFDRGIEPFQPVCFCAAVHQVRLGALIDGLRDENLVSFSDRLRAGWPGYRLFLIGLLLTAFGSGFYHFAPDNARLIWDRLPIALAEAGLINPKHAKAAAAASETRRNVIDCLLLLLYAATG